MNSAAYKDWFLSCVWFAERLICSLLFCGALILLSYFNLNVTAALAGLGVGGIAIALAAQKTLENVIGGISIIADRVVRVGDFLKIGATMGTIEDIGLRSTRIRTLDRSVVSIPNGQISNDRLEDLSCSGQVLASSGPEPSIRNHCGPDAFRLRGHSPPAPRPCPRREGLGSCTILEILVAHPWMWKSSPTFPQSISRTFLRSKKNCYFGFMDAIQAAGTRMAFPSQTTYLVSDTAFDETSAPEKLKIPVRH